MQTVVVQGLGFVGAAMCVAIASARDRDGNPLYSVIGVDIQTPEGQHRIDSINNGEFPFETTDMELNNSIQDAFARGNLRAVSDPSIFEMAQIIIVDVNLDLNGNGSDVEVDFKSFRSAIASIGRYAQPGTLVIIETTVPPGTTETIVVPILESALQERNLPTDSILVAHSYERVMPGDDYLNSITNYWRVYSGCNESAMNACEIFLSTIVNIEQFPLTKLQSPTASETAKVLENSYRAMTIAFMEEWGKFAEVSGIDLFEVIEAIRKRPTHSNIRTPGFGVGGYCLTKDPIFAYISARDIFKVDKLEFPYSRKAIETNMQMPLQTVERLIALFGNLSGRCVALFGVSYRSGVADTRYSPSKKFVDAVRELGGEVVFHDPLVKYWKEMNQSVQKTLPSISKIDAIVFAVSHPEYRDLDLINWIQDKKILIFDANNVLTQLQRRKLREIGCRVESIGRGEGL